MKVFACIRYWLYGKSKNNDNNKKEVQKKKIIRIFREQNYIKKATLCRK